MVEMLWHKVQLKKVKKVEGSITGQYLSGRKKIEVPKKEEKVKSKVNRSAKELLKTI